MYRYYAGNKKILSCADGFHLSEFHISGLYCIRIFIMKLTSSTSTHNARTMTPLHIS